MFFGKTKRNFVAGEKTLGEHWLLQRKLSYVHTTARAAGELQCVTIDSAVAVKNGTREL
jgi:hypothetical protein